jgi:HK97 family phage prohead protease
MPAPKVAESPPKDNHFSIRKGVEIQCVWIDLTVMSEEQGAAWCADHNFKSDDVRYRDEDGETTHAIFAQFSADEVVEGTWRSVYGTFPTGISVTTGERKSMSEKAYSTFIVKSFDEEERIIRGIASTPEVDREGDIVEPQGGRFKLPLPLLAQHDHSQPVGHVVSASVGSDGIEIEAQMVKGSGLPYVERVWRQVKSGLLRGLSIGFMADGVEPTKSGKRFTSWSWHELSLVTIPANASAGISTVKAYDVDGIDLDEQLLEAEAKALDVKNQALAAIELINSTLK